MSKKVLVVNYYRSKSKVTKGVGEVVAAIEKLEIMNHLSPMILGINFKKQMKFLED